MDLALYQPEHGYYLGSTVRSAREGDFLTAAELHPVFGQVLAGQLAEMWQALGLPSPFVLREYGAGPGTLDAIGARFLLSRERIRQIEAHAMSKLKSTHASSRGAFTFSS